MKTELESRKSRINYDFISKRKQKVRLSVTMATATYANSSPQRNSTKRSRYPKLLSCTLGKLIQYT